MAAAGSDDKSNSIWSLLPSFDPSSDDIKEYVAKVRFIEGICPKKDKVMLAPRLAMLCKGTAWHQVRNIKPDDLTNADNGVKFLLKALSAWEESAELKTFELFDRAIYKTTQKADESTQSFVNRLDVAFEEVGADTTLKSVVAFVLLKQSNLNYEDKKKILTMTGGTFDKVSIDNAMRSLSTNVLSGAGSEKKKVYPTNYVEENNDTDTFEHVANDQSALLSQADEEDLTQDMLEQLAGAGDADALTVQSFERELTDLFQEVPDLHSALLSYQEARGRIVERKRNRGFWPVRNQSSGAKGGKGFGSAGMKGFRKGQSKGKDELLARISRTHCKRCGELGHWKAECPLRNKESQANVASAQADAEPDFSEQVLIEEISSDREVGVETKQKETKDMQQAMFDEPAEAHVCFSEAIIDKTKEFFRSRNQSVLVNSRKPSTSMQSPQVVEQAVGLFSKTGQSTGFETNGMAILDTGASRSVIGDANLPKLLDQLPKKVRSCVKEQASRVAFRFGNNQIEHSYKQVHIPIDTHKIRMWLVVEVVPKGAPFLLSIQTMKRLGTVIDLEKNSCFLKSMNRSLKLVEGKTGLLMIRMQELCAESRDTQSIFGANCEPSSFAHIVDRNANPGRVDADGQEHCRPCHAIPPSSPDDLVESGGHPGFEPRSPSRAGGDDERIADMGASPEGEDRRTSRSDEAARILTKEGRRSIRFADRERCGGMGPRGPSVPAAGSSIRSNAGQGSTTYADTSESEVIGSWERKLSRPTAKSHRGSCKSGWNDVPWNPIAFESSERSSSWSRLSACKSEPSLDYNGHGSVGAETRDLGKETSRKDLPVGVRDRQPVRELVFEPNQFAGRPDRRFCPILPNPSTDGRAIASKPRVDVSWEVLITDQVILVETPFEAKLMSAMNQERLGKAFGKPIDLLEVYAQPNSRLSEEVRKQGGKSERFTKEHGDLTTFHGQVQLLEMIFRLRPKHVWVAPECFPWCAWNRFNAGKSMMLYEKIQKSTVQTTS